MEPRIALRQFAVTYPAFTLEPLSLEFNPGERVALVGPNGSGKTTTLRALAGRLTEYDGSILFDGQDLRGLLPLGRRKIGLLPETMPGYGWMTVREHLAFLRDFYPSWDDAYAAQLADRLRVPLDQRLGRLSKGTRVKVSFVSAEACRPPLLLLDEPTSGLDPEVRGELLETIRAVGGRAPRSRGALLDASARGCRPHRGQGPVARQRKTRPRRVGRRTTRVARRREPGEDPLCRAVADEVLSR